MRYTALLKKAEKNCSSEEAKKLRLAFESINAECDKYSRYIHNTPNITLLYEIARYCCEKIFAGIKQNPGLADVIYMVNGHVEPSGVLDEIIREKSRKCAYTQINKTDISKMYTAYWELYKFLHEMLEPLAAQDPCRVESDASHIWLQYEQEFLGRDAEVRRKLLIESEYSYERGLYIFNQKCEYDATYRKATPTSVFYICKHIALEFRAPWLFFEIEEFPLYKEENSALIKILILFDAYYTYWFKERFMRISLENTTKNVQTIYDQIWHDYFKKMFPIWRDNIRKMFPLPLPAFLFNLIFKEDLFYKKNSKESINEGNIWGMMPLCIRDKKDTYMDKYFELGDKLRYLDKLIVDLDNLTEDEAKKFHCRNAPIFKTKENGFEQYIFIPMLLSDLEYEKSIYKFTLKHAGENIEDNKLQHCISREMEKHVVLLFECLRDVVVRSTQTIKIDDKTNFEIDGLIIEQQSNAAMLIEYKHSMEFKITPTDNLSLLERHKKPLMFKKAAEQLHHRLELIAKYPREIEEKLNLPSGILSKVKFLPLIVSNSLEYDRNKFQFSMPVTVNGEIFDHAEKISFFELQQSIDQDVECMPLQNCIQRIRKNLVWEELFKPITENPVGTSWHDEAQSVKVRHSFT